MTTGGKLILVCPGSICQDVQRSGGAGWVSAKITRETEFLMEGGTKLFTCGGGGSLVQLANATRAGRRNYDKSLQRRVKFDEVEFGEGLL